MNSWSKTASASKSGAGFPTSGSSLVALTTKDLREGEAREREKEAGRERRGAGRPVKGLGRERDWEKGLELEEKALGLEEMRAAADEVAEQAISLTRSQFAVKENMGEG